MITPKTTQQSPSAEKGKIAIFAVLLFVLSAGFAMAAEAEFATFSGSWIVRFNDNLERVYKISADGAVSYSEPSGNRSGKLVVRNREVVADFGDDRITRFSKLSGTTLKVEVFSPKSKYESNSPTAIGTGRVEEPTSNVAPSSTPKPKVSKIYSVANPHPLSGVWEIDYKPYGHRVYEISPIGDVRWDNKTVVRTAHVEMSGDVYVLEFNDHRLERVALTDGKLSAAIYNDKGHFKLGLKPDFVGEGAKTH